MYKIISLIERNSRFTEANNNKSLPKHITVILKII